MNTFVVKTAKRVGLGPRWHSLRLVAGDASVLMPAIRPCFTTRFHAQADQRLFVLYLPGAELTLHASVHGADGAERQMLFESLLCLGPDDVLILDQGLSGSLAGGVFDEHYIRFCMRCEKSSGGWAEVRTFGAAIRWMPRSRSISPTSGTAKIMAVLVLHRGSGWSSVWRPMGLCG
ncbi:MAG: hypothetical protein IPN53_20355 [Comamonadaceae bacterium]|nr:hypothetical protein [Comamonadaceae bacterium]